MDEVLVQQLQDAVRTGGEAYVRNLAAAEDAVLHGQFNLAKVLRAAAHTQRATAMAAARVLTGDLDPRALLRTIVAELEPHPVPDDGSPVALALARSAQASQAASHVLRRALASLAAHRDVSEDDVAQFVWGCYECGYLAEADRPDVCPVCGALGVEFEGFGPFYSSTSEHLGQLRTHEILDILGGIPDLTAQAVAGVAEDQLAASPSPREWSAKEIIGHMLETDLLFLRRVDAVLAAAGVPEIPRPLPPWKLHEGKGYDRLPAAELLDRQRDAREASLARLRGLAPAHWMRQGRLGSGVVSILDLGTWLANHDRGHLAQLQEQAHRVSPPPFTG